jgi:5-methylcytosine-specific restriction endonuclease McrA
MGYHAGMTDQQAGNKRRAAEAAALWGVRKPEIERLYHSEGWSQARLASHYGVTQGALQKALNRLEIPSRGRSRVGHENGRYKHGMASTLYRQMVTKAACATCGATDNLCIHHKDGDHLNNDPANLEVLCMSCHSSHHKQAWWDAHKSA